MITDQQEQNMHKDQAFQWAAIKAVVIEDEKILLGRRLDKDDFGKYETPGGKIEVGENLTEALEREVLEETGIEVEITSLNDTEAVPLLISQAAKNGQLRVVLIYLPAQVKSKSKMLQKTEELSDIGFYSKEEVKDLLEDKEIRTSGKNLLQMFVEGKLEEK